MPDPILRVEDLKTHFFTSRGVVRAVDGVSFDINEGELLGLVGESASGKSVTALSIMRLVPNPPGRTVAGRILLRGQDLLTKSEKEIREIRGSKVAMCFQDPMTYLNPVMKIVDQIEESIRIHRSGDLRSAHEDAIKIMENVQIPSSKLRAKDYPHQMSGGMRQRILLAIAISCNPDLLIADEPTTALDVIVQAEILDLLKKLKTQMRSSIILITHDLGIVAELADRVAIMYCGRIVETGLVEDIYSKAAHPYTKALLESIPRMDLSQIKGELTAIPGEPPNPITPPSGCRFHPRCRYVQDRCRDHEPKAFEIGSNHYGSCWLLEGNDQG